MPYGGGALAERVGDQRRASRADPLLAQIEAPVGQRRTRREVQPLPRRAATAQPVEQRLQFGRGTRHDGRHAREPRHRLRLRARLRARPRRRTPRTGPAHHSASR
ncbi:hypothetical protein ACFQ51_35445 [Streptomyces kaempferi]